MRYNLSYTCLTHIGKLRSMNQDNYCCDGHYLDENSAGAAAPLAGMLPCDQTFLLGVFDGMGGEECGEVASLIAAEAAARFRIEGELQEAMQAFCTLANARICDYAEQHNVSCMGTTAAMLAFSGGKMALCNIGDSKIFRFSAQTLEQLSVDHYAFSVYGRKPPLSQNLGIPPAEMIIEPHITEQSFADGDVFLLCSDGLTDMVPPDEITQILSTADDDAAAQRLLDAALDHGGKDNITIILCRIDRVRRGLFSGLFRSKKKRGGADHGNECAALGLARMGD